MLAARVQATVTLPGTNPVALHGIILGLHPSQKLGPSLICPLLDQSIKHFVLEKACVPKLRRLCLAQSIVLGLLALAAAGFGIGKRTIIRSVACVRASMALPGDDEA